MAGDALAKDPHQLPVMGPFGFRECSGAMVAGSRAYCGLAADVIDRAPGESGGSCWTRTNGPLSQPRLSKPLPYRSANDPENEKTHRSCEGRVLNTGIQ